jgi:hypothetical protein
MSTPGLSENYLFLQPLLEARITEQIGQNIPVQGIEELAQAGAEDRRPFVVFVYWAGDRFNESEGGRAMGGHAQMVAQRWLVVLYVNNAQHANRQARNQAAGALLSKLHQALAGWQPLAAQPGAQQRFTRINGLKPDYTKSSGLYPLMFEIPLHL